MGFNNPRWTWSELEAALSGRGRDGRAPGSPSWNSGGDGPGWGRRRQPYELPPDLAVAAGADRYRDPVPYAELHCHSSFSFLDGASYPEELVAEAARLGLEALALTDHNGFYGIVRFAEAARAHGLSTVFGTELSLGMVAGAGEYEFRGEDATQRQVASRPRDGAGPTAPDPTGEHLVLLADGLDGYARLSRTISLGHLAGEKGLPRYGLTDVAEQTRGHVWALTGCRKGAVPAALTSEGPAVAGRELQRLIDAFGRDRVLVELWDHGDPLDSARNDALAELAARHGVGCVATTNAHYATPAQRQLATAIAAVRARHSLAELDPWLPASAGAHLRSGTEQARRFRRYPGVVERAAEIGEAARFELKLVAPKLPPFQHPPLVRPDGSSYQPTEMELLRHLVEEGANDRYGPRPTVDDPEDESTLARAWRTIDHELAVIEALGYPGYFLVVWDIVRFCREHNILCQGRGSAANSAVCYALGVTAADAVGLGLIFERFLSPERDGPPDIDVDIESDRREEVIQYVYGRHGRHHTAQVANVITYRARSAVRDMAKALGYSPGQQDAWSKQVDGWGNLAAQIEVQQEAARETPGHAIPSEVLRLAGELEDAPRHLGIHSGGMVICDRPVIEVCPVEWARMDKRSVLQWDKDDCAAIGLVKFDLLGLGMLSALRYAIDMLAEFRGVHIDIATLPQNDPKVYEMLGRADTIGVFQIESRAQMATLPRLQPENFEDLVIEVSLIRPGPIQGGSVHPYIRRRKGQEPVTYLHPSLKNSLEKTLGVPLFQEQLMQMAIDVAGFSPAESDELRQAMSSKRSPQRMDALRERLYTGMAERGIEGEVADAIFAKMKAFASYGFPQSHAVSFAYLVYASSWIKCHHPEVFCAALLNAQPLGFWSPHTLVRDARRHGVVVRGPDVNRSLAAVTLEPVGSDELVEPGGADELGDPDDGASSRRLAVRLGLGGVRGIGKDLADAIVAERQAGGDYRDLEDLVRRVPTLALPALETLATAGVFDGLGLERRQALWAAGAVIHSRAGRLPGIVAGGDPPRLPGMGTAEQAVADLWATGISADGHPTSFVRTELRRFGVVTATDLQTLEAERTVVVAGMVTHRQRPMTAQGVTFLSLEDETGLINVVVSRGCWQRFRRVAQQATAMLVRGKLERAEGVVNVVAEHLDQLSVPGGAGHSSRDFR